ncbi:hypothetical protein ACVWY2_007099 [Bradyrhizobium sp. JR6.1]
MTGRPIRLLDCAVMPTEVLAAAPSTTVLVLELASVGGARKPWIGGQSVPGGQPR